MKKFQQISMLVVLNLMFVTGAFGGIIQTGDGPPPPPDPPSATAPGIIQTGIPTQSEPRDAAPPSEAFAEIALNLLQSLLSVF